MLLISFNFRQETDSLQNSRGDICDKKKKIIIISIIIAIVFTGIKYGIYRASYDIQKINGQQYITESTSPDGKYTVTAYLNNGGATTSYAVLGTLKNNSNNKTKNIYWQYRCEKVDMEWISDDTIKINGTQLQVENEIYDFRRE